MQTPNGQIHFPLSTGELKQPGRLGKSATRFRVLRKQRKKNTNESDAEEIVTETEDEQQVGPENTDPIELKRTAESYQEEKIMEDFWVIDGDWIIRHHVNPRTKLFVPNPDDFPIPLKYIDIIRVTETDVLDAKLQRKDDFWIISKDEDPRESWTGKTRFLIKRPQPEKGFTWVFRRKTKIQKTKRPPHMYPECWGNMSKKQKSDTITEWKSLEPKTIQARWGKLMAHVVTCTAALKSITILRTKRGHVMAISPAGFTLRLHPITTLRSVHNKIILFLGTKAHIVALLCNPFH